MNIEEENCLPSFPEVLKAGAQIASRFVSQVSVTLNQNRTKQNFEPYEKAIPVIVLATVHGR
jgi:hypothetical protein